MQISINELNFDDDSYQYMELLKQLTYIDPSIITNEMFEKQLSIIKNNPFHKIIVAKIDGKIVGSTTVLIEPKFIHNLSSVGHIEDVVVDPTILPSILATMKCLKNNYLSLKIILFTKSLLLKLMVK